MPVTRVAGLVLSVAAGFLLVKCQSPYTAIRAQPARSQRARRGSEQAVGLIAERFRSSSSATCSCYQSARSAASARNKAFALLSGAILRCVEGSRLYQPLQRPP
jgi:hypothetical protein